MANPPPMLPGLGFPVDSKIDLLRKWTWNTWLWAQEDFQPSDIPGLGLWYSAGHSAFDAYTYEQAIPTLFDRSGNGWNATQSTGTAQARFLTHDGRNYLRLPGIAGNYVSTPDAAPAQLTGNVIRIEAHAAPLVWATSIQAIASKRSATTEIAYQFRLSATGRLQLLFTTGGTSATLQTIGSVDPVPFTNNTFGWVAVERNATTGDTTFLINDGSGWVQFGAVQTSTPGAIFGSTAETAIGARSGGAAELFSGRIGDVLFYNDGVLVAHCPPSRGNFNSSSVVASTGETWTINRTGLGPAMIVSARAFLPLTDDYYEIAAGAAGVLRNVGGGTIIWASSAAGASNTGMAISGGTSATENRMASSSNPTATTLSVGGRRLDSDSLVTNAVAGQQAAYGFAVQAGRLNYASALSAVFKNGSMVGTESAFQTAGNTSNTASLRMRVFANVTEVVDGFASGATTDLLLYNRALTNVEILKLSDWMAAQAGIA